MGMFLVDTSPFTIISVFFAHAPLLTLLSRSWRFSSFLLRHAHLHDLKISGRYICASFTAALRRITPSAMTIRRRVNDPTASAIRSY